MKKMITKKMIFIFSLAFIFVTIIFVLFNISDNQSKEKYNMNPDNSNKIVASKSLMDSREMITNLDQLVDFADLIIIGKVIGDQVTDKEVLEEGFLNLPSDKVKPITAINCSASKVQVKKVLYGSVNDKVIKFCQAGKPNVDDIETKVKKDNTMLFILKKNTHGEDERYYSVDAENSLFTIDESNKLMSLSDNIAVAKYDKTNLELLEGDLKKSIKSVKK